MFTNTGLLLVGVVFATIPLSVLNADEPVVAASAIEDERTSLQRREGWLASDFFPEPEHQRICQAIEGGQVDVVHAAIRGGVDVNVSGKDEMTFLMWAYATDQFEVFQKLLSLGADPNKAMAVRIASEQTRERPKSGDCVTLVIFAEAPEKWRTAVISAGGNPNFVNSKDHLSVLLAAGGRKGESRDVTRELIKMPNVDLNYQDQFGRNALMYAVMRGDYECAVALIEAGASVDCYNDIHEQLIDQVARRWINMRHRFEEQALFKKLWDEGQDRPAFERLVFLLSERGFDLQTAMLGVMRSDEMIDGLRYYEWRRKKRGHLDAKCPGVSNAMDEK